MLFDSVQRDLARDDPTIASEGHSSCLITNRPTPVRSCHLVSQTTDRETLKKLEYVWEIGHQKFDLDATHNVFHLRADWHILFDDSRWMLVPEFKIIEELKKIYLTDECPSGNLTERFENQHFFHYYVVPAPSLQEVICRFPNVNSHNHDTYPPPFSDLGPLTSHIHPHYVVFNTGQKLLRLSRTTVAEMGETLSHNLSVTFRGGSPLDIIIDLHEKWMRTNVAAQWRGHHASSNSSHCSSGVEGQDGPSQSGPPPRRQDPGSATRSQGQGTRASAAQYEGGHQRAILLQPPEDDDSSSVTDDTIVEDDTTWIEYIHNWQKRGEDTPTERWEQDLLNDLSDEQLTAYNDEHARTPPSLGAWDTWKPAWDGRKSQYPPAPDRSRFSSNDWAFFKNDVYLTRPEHPQVIL